MHEKERHQIIIATVRTQPIATVFELCKKTGASEATIRRDILALDDQQKIRRIRGGAEALDPPNFGQISGVPYVQNETQNIAEKQAIAQAAVELCDDGDSIIINGGTTTFQMVYPLATKYLEVFTNSFPIAENLLKNSQNSVILPGGMVYREQNIILSPFDNDVTRNFAARRMFMSACGLNAHGVLEADPLLIQAERKLINQAEELILLLDSSKFKANSSLVLCPIERVHMVITDDGIDEEFAEMILAKGVKLKIVPTSQHPATLTH